MAWALLLRRLRDIPAFGERGSCGRATPSGKPNAFLSRDAPGGNNLANVALGIPNAVTGKTPGGRGGNTFLVTDLRVKPVGWNGTVTPTPGASGKDFEVDPYIASTGVGVINKERLIDPKNPGDPAPTQIQKGRPGVIQQRDILQQAPAQRRLPGASQGVR